jgi:hypothetical protein
MTASQHRAEAEFEERSAVQAQGKEHPCTSDAQVGSVDPCWTSRVNPTEQSKKDAEMHRRLAAEHRAAAAIRDAEQESCTGVSERDRAESPFSHQEDIVSVQPLVAHSADGRTSDAGAIVIFREVPGLSAVGLQKIMDCHLARNAALGYNARELAYCPLNVNPLGFKKLKVTVVQRPEGLAVKLRSDDEGVGREILQRAQGLVGAPRCLRSPATDA